MEKPQNETTSTSPSTVQLIIATAVVTALVVGGVMWWWAARPVSEPASVLPENTWAISEHDERGFGFEYPAWLFNDVQTNENYGVFNYSPYYEYGPGDEEWLSAAATSVFRANGPRGEMEVLVARKSFNPSKDQYGQNRRPVQVGDQVGSEYVVSSGCYSYITETSLGIDTLVIRLQTCQGHRDPFASDENIRGEITSRFGFTKELPATSTLYEREAFLLRNLSEEGQRFFKESMDIRAHWDDSHSLKNFQRDRDGDGVIDQMDENGFFHLIPDRAGGDTEFERLVAECGSRVIVQRQKMWVYREGSWWPFKGDESYLDRHDEQCGQDPHAVYYIDSTYGSYY